MGKFVVVCTLITNLLVCPFRCLSSESDSAVAKEVAQPKCCCCHTDSDCGESSSQENEPENDCSCPNCICEGATLKDGPKASIVAPQLGDAHWLIPSDVAGQSWVNAQSTRATNRPPGDAGGRAAHIAFQVWLI